MAGLSLAIAPIKFEKAEAGYCWILGTPGIEVNVFDFKKDRFVAQFGVTGGELHGSDSATQTVSVDRGTRVGIVFRTWAEPNSPVQIDSSIRMTSEQTGEVNDLFTYPGPIGNTGFQAIINADQTFNINTQQACNCIDPIDVYPNEFISCTVADGPALQPYASWAQLNIVADTRPASFGTVAVASNVPTTWDIRDSYGIKQDNLSADTNSPGTSVESVIPGDYTITNIPLEIKNYNNDDWINPVITPALTQTLTDGGTITFNIVYARREGGSGGCNVSVGSNLPTTWHLSGPDERDGSGTAANYTDLAAGTYSLTDVPDVGGYNKEITPSSMSCGDGGSISFGIDYQSTGGGNTRYKCTSNNSCELVNESGPNQCASGPDCASPVLDCSPSSHPDVNVNINANFSASGGAAPYRWSAPGSSNPNENDVADFSTYYSTAGDKTVTLRDSANDTSTCSVRVCPAGGCSADQEPSGEHQWATTSNTGGYATDSDAPSGQVTVRIYDDNDNNFGNGVTTLLTTLTTSGSGHAFSFNLPSSVRDGNIHFIHAHVLNYVPGTGNGLEYALGSTPLRIQDTGGTHLECVNSSCTRVSGSGGNGCTPEGGACTGNNYSCSGSSCVMDSGGSYTNPSCDGACGGGGGTHLECVNSSCIRVSGSGGNGCAPEGGACSGGGTHLECRNNACASVSGGGGNLDGCSSSGQSPCYPGKHLACVSRSCKLVDGTGSNENGCTALNQSCSGGIDYGCTPIGNCELIPGGAGNCTSANEEWDCPQLPPQCTFEADKQRLVIPPPSTVTLSWNCLYAKTCAINGVSVNPRSGSKDYVPGQTAYYTLRCLGRGSTAGEWSQEVGVRVYRFIEGILREVRPN